MEKEKEKIKLSELGISANDFQLPKISELEGKTIVIKKVTFGSGKYGDYAVVELEDGSKYRTSNMVLLKQLRELEPHLNTYSVETKVKKIKNYYIFE